jgi:pentatricopeptide repeat protein
LTGRDTRDRTGRGHFNGSSSQAPTGSAGRGILGPVPGFAARGAAAVPDSRNFPHLLDKQPNGSSSKTSTGSAGRGILGPVPGFAAREAAAVPNAFNFAHLLDDQQSYPREELNASIVDQFNAGIVSVSADNVQRVTSACFRSAAGNDWNAAVACLQALSRCRDPRTGKGVFPDTITFNAAISACEKAGRADKALKLFDHMQTHGSAFNVFPDTITYSAAISACDKAGWADKALELFDHLETHGRDRDVFPNTITYNTAISACDKAGWADKALELFDHLETHGRARDVFPNTITYSAVISACEKAGRADLYANLLLSGISGVPGKPDTKVFKPMLGFDPRRNRLDSHQHVALIRRTDPSSRNPAIHPAVARAIFHVLLKEPKKILGPHAEGINDKTVFIVGQHGVGSVRDAIAECMRDQGWTPVPRLRSDGMANHGCLVVQPRQELPGGHPGAGDRKLNLFAQEFKPGKQGNGDELP